MSIINILTIVVGLSFMLNILLFVRCHTVRKERDVANTEIRDMSQKLSNIQQRLQKVVNTNGRTIGKSMYSPGPQNAILLNPPLRG